MRQNINRGKTSYGPNGIANNDPQQAKAEEGGFVSYNERIDASKIRARSSSFLDHFSQAKLFFDSQSKPEQQHIIDAFSFELGKVKGTPIRERMLGLLQHIDPDLALKVAKNLGADIPTIPLNELNGSIPADGKLVDYTPLKKENKLAKSAALSMANTIKNTIKTRKVAVLAANGVNGALLKTVIDSLQSEGATVQVVSLHLGKIIADNGDEIKVDESFLTTASVLYDAVYLPAGVKSVAALANEPDAIHFINEAYKHCKAIAGDETTSNLLEKTYFFKNLPKKYDEKTALKDGVSITKQSEQSIKLFMKMIAQHRFWEREQIRKVPA